MHIHTQVHIYIRKHTNTHTCTKYAHIYTDEKNFAIYIHMHTQVHTYTRMHTNIHTCPKYAHIYTDATININKNQLYNIK